ncbi:MAG: T9SS type A sorting domain-containing protein, partial [Flavobacteriales bacterium]
QDNISNPNYFTGGRGVIDTPTGYVISGATHVSSSNSDQFLVEKSHDDQVIFQTKFGEKAFAYGPTEQAEDLVMHNNHIYTVGSSRYSDTGYDVVVSRYDYVTKVLEDARSFTFSNTSNDFGNAIDVIVKDGQSFLLVGGSTNVQDTDGDMLAMLINPISLQLDSYRLYDNNSRRDDCKDVVVLSTGEAVLVGQSATKATAIKIESNLDLISSEQFTFNQGRTWINSIIESNGRLYMVGAMNSNPDNDVLLIRSNLNLDITFNEFTTWSSFYNDTSTDEEALEISRHPSGRLFMVGKVTRGSDEDGFAAFLGADLSIQWVKKVNEPSNSVLHSLTFSDDNEGTYMVATGKIDMDINDQDLFIVKWRTNEDICCLEEYKMRSRAFNIATQPHMDEQFRSKHNKSEVRIEDTNYPCVSLCEVGLISLRSATEIYGGQEEHGLSINPNPNNGHFELQLNSETNSLIEVSVLDASGKLINSRKFSEDQDITSDNFNYLHLRSGFYVVKVTLDNGDVLTSRIVVQK